MEVLLVAGGKHGSISRMPNAFPLVSISFFFIGWADRNFSLEIGNMEKKPWDESDLELTTVLSCLF